MKEKGYVENPYLYQKLLAEQQAEKAAEEAAALARREFVVTIATTVTVVTTFKEAGDLLVAEGYMMARAFGGGVIKIPHPKKKHATLEIRVREDDAQ